MSVFEPGRLAPLDEKIRRFGTVALSALAFALMLGCSSPATGQAATGGSAGSAESAAGASPAVGASSPGGSGPVGGAAGGASTTSGGAPSGGGATPDGVSSAGGAGGGVSDGASGAAGSGGGAPPGCTESSPGYFVDSSDGDDSRDGKTPATAWKSLDKVNATRLQPGDRLCFRAGGSWTGQLKLQGSGSSAAPIVVDQYREGARPKISAGQSDKDAVSLVNVAYVELINLEVTNQKSAPGDYRGISVVGRDAGTLKHVRISNCFVHDVTGEVNWIGGDVADEQPGVRFKTGWDASKRTGGIVFEVTSGASPAVKTRFEDVLIEGNTLRNCSFGGIVFKQLDGSVHWGVRDSASDSEFTPHSNVVIRNNYIDQHDSSLACNGVYLTGTQDALVEGNVVANAGTSAIELYYTDAVTVQGNETFGTVRKAGGADLNGIDTDKGTTKSIIQYNYVHDNGDGILLCQFAFGDSVVRYNVLQNNSRYQIYLHSDSKAKSAIYNNTLYNSKYESKTVYGYGDSLAAQYALTNNVFVSTKPGGGLTTGGGITYERNLYFGASVAAPAGDGSAVMGDPLLISPGRGENGGAGGPALASLSGYALGAGSPAINVGKVMADNGGRDLFGGKLYVGSPDLGAYEAP